MIAALVWLAQIIAGPPAPSTVLPFPQLAPAAALENYAAALRRVKEPHVISFDYTLEQTGLRTLSQTHRVFRSGSDERDETLTNNGQRLTPPKIRIFRGRRNRYTLELLAPRVTDYTFTYVGPRKNGHHYDYIFRLRPKAARLFTVTDVTIDGVRFLPLAIGFSTSLNAGAGSITFGSNARWWVPYVATARAAIAANVATEKLTFYTYRFPATLPSSTFGQARRAVPAVLNPLAAPDPLIKPARPPASLIVPARPGQAPLVVPVRPAVAPTARPLLAPGTTRRTHRPEPTAPGP